MVRSGGGAGVVALFMMATLAGCTDVLVDGPSRDLLGNVDATIGAAAVESDTSVVANGRTLVRHPSQGQALWLDRIERFENGGFPDLDHGRPERHLLTWRLALTHARPPEQHGDTVILRFIDHGQATAGGVTMEKVSDAPEVAPDTPVRFENFIRYHIVSYARTAWQSGGATTFVDAPFHADLLAGAPVTVATSGSAEAEPSAGAVVVRPHAVLVGLENGLPLDLTGTVPVVDAEQPMVLVFDRPLDPDRAFITLIPFENRPGVLRAVMQPKFATHRVVVLPHILRQLVPQNGSDPVAFRAFVIEVLVDDDVFSGRLTGDGPGSGDFTLPLVQRAETTVNLYLHR